VPGEVNVTLLTASLFFIFGQYRTGAATPYSALFTDASRLKAGDTVTYQLGLHNTGTASAATLV